MDYEKLWDELTQLAKTDDWYQECFKEVQKTEAAYITIRDSLPEEQRDQLDDYIAACEALESSLTLLAYRLGIQHGKLGFVG